MRPRILFGHHPDQRPIIERLIDHDRFEVMFASLDATDFASFNLVVPLKTGQIATARAANADGRRRAVLPDAELVATCDDKLLFNQKMIALGFEGTCCFNYKWEAGALRIFELNPRFGGSLAGDVNAYVAAHLEALA